MKMQERALTKNMAILQFGTATVDMAEASYETDFDKFFWSDLSDGEKLEYILRARLVIEETKSRHYLN